MGALKRLVNRSEETTLCELDALGREYGYRIHSKVRVADVLPIEGSGLCGQLFSFALRSHFDFVACNRDHYPLFAVEYDGPQHGRSLQISRASKKNDLCERFGISILRLNSKCIIKRYNKLSLL